MVVGAIQDASIPPGEGAHLRGALDRLDHVVLVVWWRRRAREVVDLVDLNEKGVNDIVLVKSEIGGACECGERRWGGG